jgi:hypothetical protein
VTVTQDAQEVATDRSTMFGSALTREQIDALSDDPEVLRQQLQSIAGGDAQILVDSFEGQQLPNKSQIKMIRISRDQFAAENHSALGIRIDVITQPGVGPMRANVRLGLYDSALDGRNPLVGQKAPGGSRDLNAGVSGTLIPNRMSFSLSGWTSRSSSTPVQYASTANGVSAGNVDIRTRNANTNIYGSIDYALTKDQTLRVSGYGQQVTSRNLGLGGSNLRERAFSTERSDNSIRLQEVGPLGRRFFMNHRFSTSLYSNVLHSAVEDRTIIVGDEFTSGGAQQAGESRTRLISAASDIDYVRGIHSLRFGAQVDAMSYRTDVASNYLGTFTFETLADYLAGTPRSYTRRTGDPNIRYTSIQTGFYIQDDIRVRRNLTLSPGLRYETQNLTGQYANVGPRMGVTWSPFRSGATSLRGSSGIFYDWLATGTYEQSLRIDGARQQEINLVNPSYPDPGVVGDAPPTNRYVLGSDLPLGRNTRFSAGIGQRVGTRLTINATYAYVLLSDQLVGRNLNAPVDGVRPDPRFANVIEAVPNAKSRQQTLATNANLTLGTPGALNNRGAVFEWKRGLFINGSYGYGVSNNNSDGAFAAPATNQLSDEWGPAPGDIRHRGTFGFSTGMVRNLSASVYVSASSAPPITIRTGTDDNSDLIFNDRPEGVGRNSERTAGRLYSSANISYSIALGSKQLDTGQGVSFMPGVNGYTASTTASQSIPRYRLVLSCSIFNITNHANYTGHSGVMNARFFLKPTSVQDVRQVTFAATLTF